MPLWHGITTSPFFKLFVYSFRGVVDLKVCVCVGGGGGGGASLQTVKQRKRLFGFNMDTSHAVNFRILEGGIIPLQPGPYAPDSWLKVNHLESCIIHLREKNSPHFFKVIRVT